MVMSLWQGLEDTFASWNIKPENKIFEPGLPVSDASLGFGWLWVCFLVLFLVFFSQTCSLLISSISLLPTF